MGWNVDRLVYQELHPPLSRVNFSKWFKFKKKEGSLTTKLLVMSLNASFTVSTWFFYSHPPTSDFLEPDSKLIVSKQWDVASFQPFWCIFNTAALVRTSKMRERCRTKSTNVIVHKSVTFLHTCFSAIRCCSHQKRRNCYNRPEKVLGLQTRQQFSFLLMSGILPGSSGLLVTQGTSVLHFVPWPLPWFAVAAAAVEKSGK